MPSSSCDQPNPIVQWGGGNAPSLKYNLPQGTVLITRARIPLNLEESVFIPSASDPPLNNYFEKIGELQINDLRENLLLDVAENAPFSKFLPGISALTLTPAVESQNVPTSRSGDLNEVPDGRYGDGYTNKPPTGRGKIMNASGYEASPASGNKKVVVSNNPTLGEALSRMQFSMTPNKTVSVEFIVQKIKEGLMPILDRDLRGTARLNFIKKPSSPQPRIYIIEEHRINNFLGEYGAGKVANTFTLLPGEKTSITIRTFKNKTTTQALSHSLMEQVSEEVVDEFESLLQSEKGFEQGSNEVTSHNAGGEISASYSGLLFGVSGSAYYDFATSTEAVRSSMVNTLNSALDKQTSRTNSQREVNVNTTTTENLTVENEETIVRNLENVNYSRVLNFVFRQMQQEYVTVTSLTNIKVLFTNGYPESMIIVDLERLDELLGAVINASDRASVKEKIINEYCHIFDYQGTAVSFLENITNSRTPCIGSSPIPSDYWKVKKQESTFDLFPTLQAKVPGVITSINRRTLRTDHVICDALLGQADALDCYNMTRQDAEATKATLENDMRSKLIEAYNNATTDAQKEEAIKNMTRALTQCCDVPQSSGCCAGTAST